MINGPGDVLFKEKYDKLIDRQVGANHSLVDNIFAASTTLHRPPLLADPILELIRNINKVKIIIGNDLCSDS